MIKKITEYIGLHVISMAIGMVFSMMMVNMLPIAQYGAYTIFFFAVGTVSTLTCLGINLAYGSVIGSRKESFFYEFYETAQNIRYRISVFSLPWLLIYVFYVVGREGVELIEAFLIVLSLAFAWWVDYATRLRSQTLMYLNKNDVNAKAEFVFQGARIVGLLIFWVIGAVNLTTCLFVHSLAALVKVLIIKKSSPECDAVSGIVKSAENETYYLNFVKRQALSDVFICIQPQIVLYIASVGANGSGIAEIGALSRLTQLIAPFQVVFSAFAVPMMAQEKFSVVSKFIKLCAISSLPGILLSIFSLLRPEILLRILGKGYVHLSSELLIACIGSGLALFIQSTWHLFASRGINKYTWISVPFQVMIIAFFAFAPFQPTIMTAVVLQLFLGISLLPGLLLNGFSVIMKKFNP